MSNRRGIQPEANAPVVFLSGAATELSDWTWLAEYIGGNFRIATPDVRLDNRASSADWMSACNAVLLREAMTSDGQIHIVAHGAGTIPALRFASENPGIVQSLVLIDSMVISTDLDASGFRTMADGFQRFCAEGDAAAASGWHADYWHGPGAWARTSAALRQSIAFRTGATRRDIETILSVRISKRELSSVVCPVLLINGENATSDARDVATHLSHAIPFARGEAITDAGHMSHVTAPHVTHPLVRDFLVRIAQHWHDEPVPMAMAA